MRKRRPAQKAKYTLTHARAAALVVIALVSARVDASAQSLPDVAVVLVVEVRDTAGWLLFHDRVIGTPREAARPLEVSSIAGARGRRSIVLEDPTFEITLVRPGEYFKVLVHGKMRGGDAVATLGLFQQAILERPVAPAEGDVFLFFGLVSVSAHVLELKLARP